MSDITSYMYEMAVFVNWRGIADDDEDDNDLLHEELEYISVEQFFKEFLETVKKKHFRDNSYLHVLVHEFVNALLEERIEKSFFKHIPINLQVKMAYLMPEQFANLLQIEDFAITGWDPRISGPAGLPSKKALKAYWERIKTNPKKANKFRRYMYELLEHNKKFN